MEKLIQYVSNIEYGSILNYINQHRIVTASTATLVLCGAWYLRRPRNLPPGPYGIPVFGSLFSFSMSDMKKLKEKYGDVCCIWFGGKRYWILLNSYDAIKEAFITRGDTFMDRDGIFMNLLGVHDTIFNSPYNETYKLSRKIASQGLRGLVKSKLEQTLAAELDTIDEIFAENLGKPLDLDQHFRRIYTNSILTLLFGMHFSHGDKELDNLVEDLLAWFKSFEVLSMTKITPALYSKLFLSKQIAAVQKRTKNLVAMFTRQVEQHLSTYDENNLRDLVDYYLKESSIDKFGLEKLSGTFMVFLPDAMHSAPLMLLWCIVYLLNYPQYQDDILGEIRSGGTSTSRVSMSERTKMPITEAFIMEVFRIVKPASMGVPCNPVQDTTFRGYNMPSYVRIIANLGSVMSDPKLFPEPDAFKPERFLKEGKLQNLEGYIPFGVGRRMCMGEQLVRSETFYILTNLILKYKIESPDGIPPSLKPDDGPHVITTPTKFSVVLKIRQ